MCLDCRLLTNNLIRKLILGFPHSYLTTSSSAEKDKDVVTMTSWKDVNRGKGSDRLKVLHQHLGFLA